jgi:chromosome segregation protein
VHLKSLTLKGFKSFAQPTTFEFEPGVTCVVGPNGSGKSNVVDALAWVMGEQGAKTLRGGSMEDVIFAGTANKAPLGRAEVVLTIDNSDGALPIEYSEVTISRTLFRNGGSEYAINKEPCRLLDVQELLSDSGLGREMHVIVGQGQLDQILHASPEDRRRFIEEAAGILKHRRRKEKTVRKLESMQANLTRLNDLAGEIRRQLTPLGRQAEIAKQAQTIQAIVRDAKARVLADDIVTLSQALESFHRNEQERSTERATLQEQLEGFRRRIGQLESGINDVGLDTARSIDFSLRRVHERLQALHSLATERADSAGVDDGDSVMSSGVSPEMISQKESERDAALSEVEKQESTVGEISARLATARASLQALDAEVVAATATVDRWDSELRNALSQVEVHASRVEAASADVDRQRAALGNAKDRARDAEEALQAVQGSSDKAPDAVAEAFEKALEEAEAFLATADAHETQTRNTLHAMEREREALAAKVSALDLALRTDGEGSDVGSMPGVTGSVSDSLTVTKGFETAIARALGSLADAHLVGSKKDALSVVSKRASAEGRVELVIAQGNSSQPAEIAGLTPALSVVTGPSGVLALLASTYVAEDLAAVESAWGAGTIPPGVTVVTPEGDVFGEHVIRTGSGEAQSRLELAAERDSTKSALDTLSTELERIRFDAEQAQGAKVSAAEAVKTALADLRQADASRAEFGEQVSRVRASLDAAHQETTRLGEALERAEAALVTATQQHTASIAAHESFQATTRPGVDESKRLEARALVDAIGAEEVDARIALEASRQRAAALGDQVDALVQRVAEEEQAREREQARYRERVAKAKRASAVLQLLPPALAAAAESVEKSGTALLEAEAARQSSHQELVALREREASVRERLTAITDSVHSLEMQVYEKKLQRTTLLERAMEELGLDEDALLEAYSPEAMVPADGTEDGAQPQPFVRAQQEARLKKAERTLDQLGRVNPLALEEFDALEARHTFLTEQLADLKKTRADLEAIMEELDTTMHTIFAEAFADTQRAFDEVFPILFPGGSGSLKLTDPSDMLATGIDVAVRPAGKKIERLSLLSGGERSLAAVALLIAIFKARPSPFYILDEVEAALDDSNLGRLLAVIQTLRDDSQLIIITHQKRTMEIADALYGVSMRKDGVSAVVGQRVSESEALAS